MSEAFHQFSFFEPVHWTGSERDIWRKRERLTVSEFAEKHITVVGGAMPGPWRNQSVPYLVQPMDTYGLPYLRELVICAVAQSGKTRAAYNCLFWSQDRDPGPAMTIMSGQQALNKFYADFLIPTMQQSERLAAQLSHNPDDTAKRRIRLKSGVTFYPAWATSAAGLATFGIRYMIFDETDKYPEFVGKETDPITLGEKRTRVFERRGGYKRIYISTPTNDSAFIWKKLQSCHQVWVYDVCCPACGKTQQMKMEQLRWPEKHTPEELESQRAARYHCQHCDDIWDERRREMAIHTGAWRCTKGADLTRPGKVGFHIPAWIVLDISLTEIAVKWKKAQHDRAALIDFYNDVLAEPFEDNFSEREEDRILALCDERPASLVPLNTAALLIAIDTQQIGYYYEVRAFGYGLELEGWQVRVGFVESDDALKRIIYGSRYTDSAGTAYQIQVGFIDSGGTKEKKAQHSRTWEVYEFCRLNPIIKPIKGVQRQSRAWKVFKVDTYPGTGKPIPGGLMRYDLNVTYYKDMLAGKLEVPASDPGAWHLHEKTPVVEDYARQMCSEYRDERGYWQCPSSKANHFWDVSVYMLALADILGIKDWKQPDSAAQPGSRRRIISKGIERP
ncbi:phage terminase large subunit family protein [bacterium]|nr:phage terminase large subunit family protein [bacterium]